MVTCSPNPFEYVKCVFTFLVHSTNWSINLKTFCIYSNGRVYLYEKSKIPFSYMLYAYSVKEPIGELNLKRALDEDTGVFSSFFSLLSSSSPLESLSFLYLDLL